LVKLGIIDEKEARKQMKGGTVSVEKIVKQFKQKKLFGKSDTNEDDPVNLITPEKSDRLKDAKTEDEIYSKTVKIN